MLHLFSDLGFLVVVAGGLSFLSLFSLFLSLLHSMITSNLPSNNFVVVLVELSYSVGLYFTYPIQMWPAIQILEGSRGYRSFVHCFQNLKKFEDDDWNSLVPSMIFRTFLVLLTLICATTIPKFGTFVAIIGSISCSLIAYILPSLFSLKLHPHATPKETWIKYGMCAFGAVGGVVSFVIEMVALFGVKEGGGGEVDEHAARCFNGTR